MGGKKNYLVPFIIFLIISIVLAGVVAWKFSSCDDSDKAMLRTFGLGWGEDPSNPDTLLFSYRLENYGDKEAKDIKIRCKIIGESDETIFSSTKDYGALPANSVALGFLEAPMPANLIPDSTQFALCYVESCSNCKILYQNIPDLKQNYELS